MLCLLCRSDRTRLFWTKPSGPQKNREYVLCETCFLIFVPPHQHLSLTEQKTFYDHHQNHPEDAGYVRHLQQLTNPLQNLIEPGQSGLDYGSGPGPTLGTILQKQGLIVKNYDPVYAPQTELLQTDYDFVTCTEVVEHFSNPHADWKTLLGLVKPDGILGVMTQQRPNDSDFADWWYHRDVTHVCFYHEQTFSWLAKNLNLKILFQKNPVVIFCKK